MAGATAMIEFAEDSDESLFEEVRGKRSSKSVGRGECEQEPTQRARPTDKELLVAHYHAVGKSFEEIAVRVQMPIEWVAETLKQRPVQIERDLFAEEIARAAMKATSSGNLAEDFENEAQTAFETLRVMLRHPRVPWSIKRLVAIDILLRAKNAPQPVKSIEDGADEKHVHLHLPPKQVTLLHQTLQEVGNENAARLLEEILPEED
jgi:hypothetical protein